MKLEDNALFWYNLSYQFLGENNWREIKFLLDGFPASLVIGRRFSTKGTGEKIRYHGMVEERQINTEEHISFHAQGFWSFEANYRLIEIWRRHGLTAVPVKTSYTYHKLSRGSHLTDEDTEHYLMLALMAKA